MQLMLSFVQNLHNQILRIPSHIWPILYVVVLSAALLLPLSSSRQYEFERSRLHEAIHSGVVRTYAACAISACIPLLIDVLLDLMHEGMFSLVLFRSTSLLSPIVFCTTVLLVQSDHSTQIVVALMYWQVFIQVCLNAWLLQSLDEHGCLTTSRNIIGITLFFALLMNYEVAIAVPSYRCQTQTPIVYILGTAFALLYAFTFCFWLYKVSKEFSRSNLAARTWFSHLSHKESAVIVLNIVSMISAPVYTYFIFHRGDDCSLPEAAIAGSIFAQSFMGICSSLLPGRLLSLQTIEDSSRLKFTKGFVKYVSHEMRTPINIMCTGIEMIGVELANYSDVSPVMSSTVMDMMETNSDALDILDDVLLFDQIQSNTLIMELLQYRVVPLVRNYMFSMRALALQTQDVTINVFPVGTTNLVKINGVTVNVDEDKLRDVFQRLLRISLLGCSGGSSININADLIEGPPILTRLVQSSNRFMKLGSIVPMRSSAICEIRFTIPMHCTATPEELRALRSGALHFERRPESGFVLHFFICKKVVELQGGKLDIKADEAGRMSVEMRLPATTSDHSSKSKSYDSKSRIDHKKEFREHVTQRYIAREASALNQIIEEELEKEPDSKLEKEPQDSKPDKTESTPEGIEIIDYNAGTVSKSAKKQSTKSDKKFLLRDRSHRNFTQLDILDANTGLHILIVDDSAINRKLLLRLFKMLGHVCEEADNGQVAVDAVKERIKSGMEYDVIILDNEMPVMTGRDAVLYMRETLNYKGIVLGVTGNVMKDEITDFIAMGVDFVIHKPLTVEAFEKAMLQLYRGSQKSSKIMKRSFVGLGVSKSRKQNSPLHVDDDRVHGF